MTSVWKLLVWRRKPGLLLPTRDLRSLTWKRRCNRRKKGAATEDAATERGTGGGRGTTGGRSGTAAGESEGATGSRLRGSSEETAGRDRRGRGRPCGGARTKDAGRPLRRPPGRGRRRLGRGRAAPAISIGPKSSPPRRRAIPSRVTK